MRAHSPHGADAAEALAKLREYGAVRRPDDAVLDDFLTLYYGETAGAEVDDRKIDDVYAAAVAHLDLGRLRQPGEAVVRVLSPERERDGWRSPHTVVLVVADDMPFLVDTTRMVLERHRIDIHLVVHPMLAVERDGGGELRRVAAVDADPLGDGRFGDGSVGEALVTEALVTEAWTQIEIDPVDDETAAALERELRDAVADVRAVVTDFDAMRQRLHGLAHVHPALDWFADGQFVFLGAIDTDCDDAGTITPRPASGLGQLRDAHPAALAAVSFATSARGGPTSAGAGRESRPAVMTRADAVATVFRPRRENVLIVSDPAEPGLQHRFVGLLSSGAQRANVLEIPGFGDEIAAELDLGGNKLHSHSGRTARTILDHLPRDVVLELSASEVAAIVRDVMGLQERRLVRVFEVPEPVGLWTTVLVYLPRGRFTAGLPEAVADLVAGAYGAIEREYDSSVGGSSLARVTVTVRRPDHDAEPDLGALERAIDEGSTSWDERLAAALRAEVGELDAQRLLDRYGSSPSDAYRAAVSPQDAVTDLQRIGQLLAGDADLVASISHDLDATSADWRMRVYRRGAPMVLSDLLPLLDHLGFVALDEQPFVFEVGGERVFHYDIGVRLPAGVVLDDRRQADLREAFGGLVDGSIENDRLNRLVLLAGLNARQVAVLRAYSKYLRQINFQFSQSYVEETLAANAAIARQLVALFEVRFDPQRSADQRDADQAELREEIVEALDEIPSLDHDRICRVFHSLIEATVRTNFFRGRSALAFKFDPHRIDELPLPRPVHEVWVCGPRVEGVHLRGGDVARGGLRWSDRREDFRTEVLGLMKAQMVKNAVIVPTGAKGGFVVKRMPAAVEDMRVEVAECYRMFVASLLDITDNLVDGSDVEPVAVRPPDTVAYDGDDPYLVVAADKGTATFSDLANEVALAYGYWLGDAFASGGSSGYDHKAMGITARGAWESVRRHARVLGRDADRDPLTAVGIGDMSGDVFGNGMLRSPALRLVAAFDHRHIFLDPNPDAAAAFAERRRLFELPRSSWADYDTRLLSPGGAVYPRTLKSIRLGDEARSALGVTGGGPRTPDEVISIILKAPVDLLWNGGIGTYVKASSEAHGAAGDRANDSVRVDARELRCKMVGEGGNLGLTQLARVEFSLGGGLIYTDAIDNSAGVDCSDHEVNIKVLLGAAVANGDITLKQRNELLESMTDEVAELVLGHNKAQTLALVMARSQSAPMANVHARYIEALETEGWLDRAMEHLPSDKQIAERQLAGGGLTTPEFAVLIAYMKNANVAEVVASDLPDSPAVAGDLVGYFPRPLRERFGNLIESHPLRREIVATAVVNRLANMSGISFEHRMTEETGASVIDVTRAWLVAREVFGFDASWRAIDRLEQEGSAVKIDTQLELFLSCRQLIERGALWFLRHRRPPFDVGETAAPFVPGIAELSASLGRLLRGRMADVVVSREASLLAAGVPERLAERAAVWPLLHTALDAVELAASCGHPVGEVAAVQWELFAQLDLMWLWDAIGRLPRSDRWQTQARSSVRDDLLSTIVALTETCLPTADDGVSSKVPSDVAAGEAVEQWIVANERAVERVGAMLTEIRRAETYDLTTLSVALRQLRNLSRTASQ